MSSSIAKKLTNVSTLYYLFVLEKHFPDDRKKIKQKQNKNVHKLMKRAYEIPFYRKRFDACHLTPDDFHCSEDLQKFPVLTKAEGMPDVIRELNEYHPDLICLRKNCIVRIALYAQEHNLTVRQPKWYIPVSEMVDEMTRMTLEKTFGPGLVDAYGSDETGSCIIKRPGKDYYDICNDTHVVNIYDDKNELADNGRVIITPLFKTDFPLINYDIGDIASSYVKDGVRYVTKIHGRLNDMVRHENGEETSVLELRKITNGITGIAQFRFTQESYHDMRVELVRDPMDTAYTKEEIESFFRKKLHDIYGDEFRLRIDWLDVIPPDPNGKLRCFVCQLPAKGGK